MLFLLDKSLGSLVSRWDVANVDVFGLFRPFLLARRLLILPRGRLDRVKRAWSYKTPGLVNVFSVIVFRQFGV